MRADSALFAARYNQIRLYFFAILIYVGIASLFVVPAIQRAHTQTEVKGNLSQYLKEGSAQGSYASNTLLAEGRPTAISIDRLRIKLPIAPGYYNVITHKWTLDNSHVFTDSYTNPSPSVSAHQSRVTFMYGHDIPGVLIKTSQLTFGDIMTVDTDNGYQFRYYYDKSKVINPTDTSVLKENNTGDPVVLATCTGAWYQFRHAMYFRLISVRKLPNGPVVKVKS